MLTSKDIYKLRAQGVMSMKVQSFTFDALLSEVEFKHLVLIKHPDKAPFLDHNQLLICGVLIEREQEDDEDSQNITINYKPITRDSPDYVVSDGIEIGEPLDNQS